jgi:hypothetical protein
VSCQRSWTPGLRPDGVRDAHVIFLQQKKLFLPIHLIVSPNLQVSWPRKLNSYNTARADPGGFAALFNNPTYGAIFATFSPSRLFTPVGSNVTEALFFVPGSNGTVPATVSGFGAVFTDVDQPDGSGPSTKRGNRGASTLVEYFGVDGKVLFSSFVPASPGDFRHRLRRAADRTSPHHNRRYGARPG